MIPTSTTPRRYVPAIFDQDDPEAPAFFLRAGTAIERSMLEAELAGECRAARVFAHDLTRVFNEGVAELMKDDPGRDTLLALSAAEQALGEGEQLPADERQLLATARDVLAEHWPEYRQLIAQSNRRHQLLPLFAFRRFCTGWENVAEALPFALAPDKLVTLDATGSIPELLMKLAGYEAYAMLQSGTQVKNSAAPSKSGADQKTSTSA